MDHRHLTHQQLTLAAMDDIISRGMRLDWEQLRDAVRNDPSLLNRDSERIPRRLRRG